VQRYVYPARFTADRANGGFVVTFRDLKGAITQGDSVNEALSQAADCLDEYLAFCIREGRDIPRPSPPRRGERLVPVPALMAAKAALYLAMRQARISNVALARRLGCDEKDVRRMLDPRHSSKIATLQAALSALGKQIVLAVKNAA